MNSEYETQSCTSSSNRQCSTCTTMCPPGTMLSGVCSGSSNKKCVKCDINYYKLLNDDSPCIACDNICNSGFELIETIWDNKCYGYVLDRVIIITLFTKDQQNLPLLSKKNLKFPLNISYDLSSKNSFIYCKEKNLHYLNNNVFLDNSLGSFQKIYSSLSNSFLLTLFEKRK